MADIDLIHLNFDPQTLFAMNVVLGLVMFGVSLEIEPDDFKEALRTPRALFIGLMAHHVVLLLGLPLVAGLSVATFWSRRPPAGFVA